MNPRIIKHKCTASEILNAVISCSESDIIFLLHNYRFPALMFVRIIQLNKISLRLNFLWFVLFMICECDVWRVAN